MFWALIDALPGLVFTLVVCAGLWAGHSVMHCLLQSRCPCLNHHIFRWDRWDRWTRFWASVWDRFYTTLAARVGNPVRWDRIYAALGAGIENSVRSIAAKRRKLRPAWTRLGDLWGGSDPPSCPPIMSLPAELRLMIWGFAFDQCPENRALLLRVCIPGSHDANCAPSTEIYNLRRRWATPLLGVSYETREFAMSRYSTASLTSRHCFRPISATGEVAPDPGARDVLILRDRDVAVLPPHACQAAQATARRWCPKVQGVLDAYHKAGACTLPAALVSLKTALCMRSGDRLGRGLGLHHPVRAGPADALPQPPKPPPPPTERRRAAAAPGPGSEYCGSAPPGCRGCTRPRPRLFVALAAEETLAGTARTGMPLWRDHASVSMAFPGRGVCQAEEGGKAAVVAERGARAARGGADVGEPGGGVVGAARLAGNDVGRGASRRV